MYMYIASSFRQPIDGIIGNYGKPSWPGYVHLQVRTPEGRKDRHIGDDYNAKSPDEGLPVFTVADGVVDAVIPWRWKYGFGNHVFIRHFLTDQLARELVSKYGLKPTVGNRIPMIYSHYAHLKMYKVKRGEWYRKGDYIGQVGKTGTKVAHLHFDLRRPTGMGYESYPSFADPSWIKQYYLTPYTFIEQNRG